MRDGIFWVGERTADYYRNERDRAVRQEFDGYIAPEQDCDQAQAALQSGAPAAIVLVDACRDGEPDPEPRLEFISKAGRRLDAARVGGALPKADRLAPRPARQLSLRPRHLRCRGRSRGARRVASPSPRGSAGDGGEVLMSEMSAHQKGVATSPPRQNVGRQ